MSKKIIIIGAGASGMIAAIVAKRNGSNVILLEKNDRIGKKLLATGNGRCNYANQNITIDNYHGENPKFAYSALKSFNYDQTIDFFERLGITPAVEDGGKVFPLSFQSSSMLDVLRYEIEDLNIDLRVESEVIDIIKKDDFIVKLKEGKELRADKVILATGGMAMPGSGSNGDGYSFAKSLGHSITDTFPGLVQLKLDGNIFKGLKGVKFKGLARLYERDKILLEDSGDILFTDYGISGPPILQLSRTALYHLNKNREVNLEISIIHARNLEELKEYLNNRFLFMTKRSVEDSLVGLINKRLIRPILKEVNIDKNKKISHISQEEVERLAGILISWKFKIIGSLSFKDAQVTAGGVSTKEIDSKTMESKLVKGLYITGELLDIDGDCGGFNLQWAWSSGYIAGINASL